MYCVVWKLQGGGGGWGGLSQRLKKNKEKYDANLEFPGGWGRVVLEKIPSMMKGWISETIHIENLWHCTCLHWPFHFSSRCMISHYYCKV